MVISPQRIPVPQNTGLIIFAHCIHLFHRNIRHIERAGPYPLILPQQIILFDNVLVILIIIQNFREYGNLFRICRKQIQFINKVETHLRSPFHIFILVRNANRLFQQVCFLPRTQTVVLSLQQQFLYLKCVSHILSINSGS